MRVPRLFRTVAKYYLRKPADLADTMAHFGTKMGFEVKATDYGFPVRLWTRETLEVGFWPAYLNARLFGHKAGRTPEEYIYEYDVELPSGA